MSRAYSLALLAILSLTPSTRGQSTFGMPANVPHNLPPHANLEVSGGVLTPDGRVMLYSSVNFISPGDFQSGGWFARVLRHESVTTGANGVPSFGSGAWSSAHRFAFDEPPPNWNFTPQQPFDNHVVHGWLTAGPDPAFAHLPVPFRSDAQGKYAAQGSYETYRLCIVAPVWWPIAGGQLLNLTNPPFGPPLSLVAWPMARRELMIVVSLPRSVNASIHSAQLLEPTAQIMTYQAGAAQHPILGIEPSITMDGRLLVFQGNPANNGLYTAPYTMIDRVMYSFNQTPFALNGWSEPRMLNEMHTVHAGVRVAGRRFDERYPIAKKPLRDGAGGLVTGQYWGAYPWITLDGTDIVHTTRVYSPNNSIRTGLALIGRSTGWKLQHIDGPVNMDRGSTERFVFTGTGVAPGIWSPGRDMLSPPLPYARHGLSMPLFGIKPAIYGEVSLEEYLDGDYLVALPMNEVVQADPAGTAVWSWALNKTADLSWNGQPLASPTGLLEGGASFPQDLAGAPDVNGGVIGQAVSFADDSRVSVATPPASPAQIAKGAITVELFVRDPSIAASPIANPRFHLYAHHPGVWFVLADENGTFMWGVHAGANLNLSSPVGGIATNSWTHLAMTYRTSASGDTMQIFRGGVLVATQSFPGSGALGVNAAIDSVMIGPAGFHVPIVGAYGGRLLIDEFKYSRVIRTADEIARHARLVPTPTSWTPSPSLPQGLVPAAARIPTNHPFTTAAVNLGAQLFHDPGLSAAGTMSCATCHQAARDFTDGNARAIGNQGQLLPRNTPTVINRLFSTAQLWDGRAVSLEEQALHPIQDPNEMAANLANVISYLNGSSTYSNLFNTVYGSAANATNLAQALASYQRSLVSGGSPFDVHRAGGTRLSSAALAGHDLFFGKARCFSCHHGTNLTDEAFHVTLVNDADAGRGAITSRVFDAHRFKTPTLRNVANTAPYFHDGSATSLLSVVNLYNVGGARNDVVDHEIVPLGLTATEVNELVAFLTALTASVTHLQP